MKFQGAAGEEYKSMIDKYFVVLTTCPDEPSAASLARRLVEERLAACVNRAPGIRSTYQWQGAVQEDEEVLLIAKTSAERLATLSARIQELHPYEVPEVLALPVAAGAERYLAWIGQTVGRGG
jgi:periplasmic divalent cation tolerance protein